MAIAIRSQVDAGVVDGNGVISILATQWDSAIYDGLTIPPDSILYYAGGQHDGATSTTVLSDSTAAFPTAGSGYDNLIARNTSKATSTVIETMLITSNAATTATGSAALSNSTTWEAGNYYEIVMNISASDVIEYQNVSAQGGAVTVSVKGVPSVTGTNEEHTFLARIVDVSDGNSVSATFTVTVTPA